MRPMETPLIPVEVFYSFAETDAPLLTKLDHHLSLLQRRGVIAPWHKRQISAGHDWQEALDAHLNSASLILLLISPDFLASDYCYETEMQQALRRHAVGQARVVPILLRPVDWHSAPFAHLQALPSTKKAITTWRNQDEAWAEVAQGIRLTLEEMSRSERQNEPAPERKRGPRSVPFPPIWNVPYRYSFFFTGRERVVEQIFRTFTSKYTSRTIPSQALSGLGGLGKTQTAVEYAYRYRQEYRAVLWMNGETEEALFASFKTAGELLRRPGTHLQNRQSLVASIHEWLRTNSDWLLILDNADDIPRIVPFLPQAANGHLLLTTRATALGSVAQPLPLVPLEPDEGALCLLRRASYLPWSAPLSEASPASVKAARDLAQLMDGLPLALEQAGAYIEATGRTMTSYLELYRHFRKQLQETRYGPVPTYRTTVAFTWTIAREAIQDENPAALELLYLCAFLAPHGIPYELFTSSAHLLGTLLGAAAANPLAFDRAISLLLRHSLLKKEVDRETDLSRLIIHPVLQEVLRDCMDPPTRRAMAEQAIHLVTHTSFLIQDPIMKVHSHYATALLREMEQGE